MRVAGGQTLHASAPSSLRSDMHTLCIRDGSAHVRAARNVGAFLWEIPAPIIRPGCGIFSARRLALASP